MNGAAPNPGALDWRWTHFSGLGLAELYAILEARNAVFVCEQDCAYNDTDGLDGDAWHLLAIDTRSLPAVSAITDRAGATVVRDMTLAKPGSSPAEGAPPLQLGAYLRVIPPPQPHDDLRIGRVLTAASHRGAGLGRLLFARGLRHAAAQWPGVPIRLHAQARLERFYGSFGFTAIAEPDVEDGIPHVWMRRC